MTMTMNSAIITTSKVIVSTPNVISITSAASCIIRHCQHSHHDIHDCFVCPPDFKARCHEPHNQLRTQVKKGTEAARRHTVEQNTQAQACSPNLGNTPMLAITKNNYKLLVKSRTSLKVDSLKVDQLFNFRFWECTSEKRVLSSARAFFEKRARAPLFFCTGIYF